MQNPLGRFLSGRMRNGDCERFCVRNSGARVVVEGVGDHGCEYMTGGRVVVLGNTGRNFGAGMSGGIAYVLDREQRFSAHCNLGMVELEEMDDEDAAFVHGLVTKYFEYTESQRGRRVIDSWQEFRGSFVKVMPRDYKRVLRAEAQARAESREPGFAELVGAAED